MIAQVVEAFGPLSPDGVEQDVGIRGKEETEWKKMIVLQIVDHGVSVLPGCWNATGRKMLPSLCAFDGAWEKK